MLIIDYSITVGYLKQYRYLLRIFLNETVFARLLLKSLCKGHFSFFLQTKAKEREQIWQVYLKNVFKNDLHNLFQKNSFKKNYFEIFFLNVIRIRMGSRKVVSAAGVI